MIAVVLASALATAALLTVAHVRTSQVTAGAGSAVVTEVRDGETPAALAVRVDPDAPVDVTLARIAEMNDLDAGALTSGHRLLVPAPDRG
ncbi:LysM peptidoglycan-binding domain-containing protein [Rhodococcus sp. BL-253-APC-6A1W]|nr:LysM peptidoglycan-binding domain-containing protein [Rhodococcus sp. BL-253-APC-6A1W]NME79763.1 LysM peptidoglycan-binding domain-containing protein [Rhodococcus sp. 105337]